MKRIAYTSLALLLVVSPAAAACDPHYRSETCVPIAKDLDRAGGKGNGPAYVQGPFAYEGEDIYDLDIEADGSKDGIACEPLPKR